MYKWEIAEHLKAVDFAKGNESTLKAINYIAKKNPKPAQTEQDAPVSQETVEPVVA
jgi:hypothetical protein